MSDVRVEPRVSEPEASAPPPPLAGPRADEQEPFTHLDLGLLGAITLIAAALRLYRLGEWSFWVDEAHTYRDVVSEMGVFWSSHVSSYPLSYLLLRGLVDLGMPTSEGWMRLPFTFFGILSIPALGLVGRTMVGRHAALIGALLLAVSPWHIYWSQNARAYAMVLFFVLMAAGGFYNGVERRSPALLAVTFGLTILAGLCHPSAYLLLAGFFVYGLLMLRDVETPRLPSHRWLPLLIIVVIAVLVWLLLPLVHHVRRSKPDFTLFHLIQTLVFFVRMPLLVAAIGGMLWMFDRGDRAATFLMCWVVVPVLALAVLASGIMGVTAQYAFYTLPAFCLLGGTLALAVAERVAGGGFRGHLLRAALLGILLLDMAGHGYLYFDKYHGERPRWREAAEYVLARPGLSKRVVTTNQPSMSYYLDPAAFTAEAAPAACTVVGLADYNFEPPWGETEFIREQIQEAAAAGEDLYVVLTEPELYEMSGSGAADTFLRTNLLQVRRLPNWTGPKDMTVLVYQPR